MGQIGEGASDAVPDLIQALQDQDHQVRMNAASTLGSIGSEVAVPALIKLLQDPNAERFGSVSVLEEALGKIGTPEALKAIEEYESQ